MPNKVTLDFETGLITWDTDSMKGTEWCADLAAREEAILSAIGYKKFDCSDIVNAINAYVSRDDE